jgi:hypothetical protein
VPVLDTDRSDAPEEVSIGHPPSTVSAAREIEIDDGVLKEARRRQRKRHLVALTILVGAGGIGALAATPHQTYRARSTATSPTAASTASTAAMLAREPDLSVACDIANSVRCDRVGLAIWLRQPAYRVTATIAGRPLKLDDPIWSGPASHGRRTLFAGFLQPAGMLNGTLKVDPDRGSYWWAGGHPTSARVQIVADYGQGRKLTTTVTLELRAGWG